MRKLLLMLTIAAIPIASNATESGAPPGMTVQQAEIFRYRQQLRAQEDALRAQANASSNPEEITAIAEQIRGLQAADMQLELRYIDTLKSPETP